MFAPRPLPRTFDACLRDLEDPKPTVRAHAASDLARHTDGERRAGALSGLERALGDSSATVRSAAAIALADAHAVESVPALVKASDDADEHVRQMAVSALGEIGGEAAAARVDRALADPSAEVRFQAVIAYPRLASDKEKALAALEAATRDSDALVVHIALRMAEELGEAAGEVDARLVRRARALLGHASSRVQIAAAILLGRSGDHAGDDLLVALARGDIKTGDGADEATAVELCGELGLEGARAGLERRAFGGLLGLLRDRFQWHALVALARMGHVRARRDIERDLRSWDVSRRTLAVAAAGRARLTDAKEQLLAMRRDGRADAHALDEALRAIAEPG